MPYELIITEKPSSAVKIAQALDDRGKPMRKTEGGVNYFWVSHNRKDIVVCSAVGHLFTVQEAKKGPWTYPVFDVEWVLSADASKGAAFTKKYATLIKKLSKDATEFTVATDYDIEGEVIGYNVIKYLCKQKDANRMKFSTLTKSDLIKSYENKAKKVNWGQVNAGLTRHELDWYYGINLSRALSLAMRSAGQYKVLSAGRVQGPALKIITDKEKEIQKFIPEPFWTITLLGHLKKQPVEAIHKVDKIFDQKEADRIYAATKSAQATVDAVDEKQFTQKQPTPFDLTTLQTECYRVHGISPKETLALAQDLYTEGFISYPRTSSQKLPKELELKQRIQDLLRHQTYKPLAEKLLAKGWTTPNEGAKTDDAHPAIHPTGILPQGLDARHEKLYDLVVRRFLACFADEAKRATMTITFDCAKEPFIAKGTRTVYLGWHEFYGPYAKFEEVTLPAAAKGDVLAEPKVNLEEKQTKPPKRYTPASIIKELEKKNLGTKATRAAIVDNLYDRGYVKDKAIQATILGLHTADILEKYSPTILDQNLTQEFEEMMEEIRKEEKTPQEVLDHAKKILKSLLADFKEKQQQIGEELVTATRSADEIMNTTVSCPICRKEGRDGIMMIRKAKYGRFLGCSQYPDCKNTYNLPDKGEVKASGQIDPQTGQELLSVRTSKIPVLVNIHPDAQAQQAPIEDIPGIGEPCPNCGTGKFMLRKSLYGAFLGCDNYPKCKTMRPLKQNEDGTYILGDVITKTTTKKAVKKKAVKKAVKKKTATKKAAPKKTAKK